MRARGYTLRNVCPQLSFPGVPSLNTSSYSMKSRLSVDVVLKECQGIVNGLCDDTSLKIFKRVAGRDQSTNGIYVPHIPCSNQEVSETSFVKIGLKYGKLVKFSTTLSQTCLLHAYYVIQPCGVHNLAPRNISLHLRNF